MNEGYLSTHRIGVNGDSHMPHTSRAGGATGEKQQVARLHLITADFLTLCVLG